MIRNITIAREFGSGGAATSRVLAGRLGWRLLDRELIDEIVRVAGVDRETAEQFDERTDPLLHRLVRSLAHGGFDAAGAAGYSGVFDAEQMRRCTRRLIEHAAAQGECVIVGRGGQCVLQDRDDTLNVFIWAPLAWKVRWVRRRHPDEPDPEGLITRTDRERAAFIRSTFGRDWYDHRLYDLMINASLGGSAALECIAAALRAEQTE